MIAGRRSEPSPPAPPKKEGKSCFSAGFSVARVWGRPGCLGLSWASCGCPASRLGGMSASCLYARQHQGDPFPQGVGN